MAKPPKPLKGGLTTGKCISIGILAVVLLVVIAANFGGRKESVGAASHVRRAARENPESTGLATSNAPGTERSEKPWPTFDVAAVIASNPFALPEVLRPGSQAMTTLTANSQTGEAESNIAAVESADVREMRRRQSEFMASLRAKGVDMILESSRGSVARIGDLSLRVGDVHEGLRVEKIGKSGVVFAPTLAGELQPE
ncbi:MAG TPA: hypothetical protein VMM76_27705 [Pirellulaceae bacterium]|nr:hypothetical protein [Pirellulaceae bacterium]